MYTDVLIYAVCDIGLFFSNDAQIYIIHSWPMEGDTLRRGASSLSTVPATEEELQAAKVPCLNFHRLAKAVWQ